MNAPELKQILDLHKKWLNGEAGGKKANLSSANLRSADLRYADLSYANLISADLSSADLSYANLRSAHLSSADLSSAYLYNAILEDVRLSGAKMEGVHHSALDVLAVKNLDSLIAKATEKPRALNMGDWHTCKTTHCRAGWAVVIAGDAAKGVESVLGTPATAALIYAASRPGKPIPDFYSDNATARASIIEDAKAEKAAAKKKTAKASRA